MSGMETPEPIDKIAERTAMLAAEAGKRAGVAAEQFLEQYSRVTHPDNGVLDQWQIEAVADTEKIKAAERYTAERNAGKHNDTQSIGSGLDAIVKAGPKHQLEKVLGLVPKQSEFRFTKPASFEEIEDSPPNSPLYRMHLPRGVFFQDKPEGNIRTSFIRFHTEGIFAYGRIMTSEGFRINAYAWEVIRIEGHQGEFWQNPEYYPDSTERPHEPPLLDIQDS